MTENEIIAFLRSDPSLAPVHAYVNKLKQRLTLAQDDKPAKAPKAEVAITRRTALGPLTVTSGTGTVQYIVEVTLKQ